ncbi:alpha beta-hydrolase [Trichoderma arundinaceum]|uniref:Alpha beta-hydrolase n=1 Tax=Trichoderma arundinaceum TaxID=490622 RepID=A0A395NRR5_TRIAR|nr:alpha beta-hydrolase [Trichoderma arundinaceum]
MTIHQTTSTQYITTSDGVKYAYRRIGPSEGVPLVMHGFFRSNMDFWDPILINNLAKRRPVILFDQAGVGRSSGTIPTTYQGWADCQINLTNALGIKRYDVAGFSMGGLSAQLVALEAPDQVRKLVLMGTTAAIPRKTSDVAGIVWPREKAQPEPMAVLTNSGSTAADVQHAIAASFFYQTDAGRAATERWWDRVNERKADGEAPLLEFVNAEGTARQVQAVAHWNTPEKIDAYDRLTELKMPVLVMNGDDDLLVPSSRSWELAKKIPNSQLIIYPNAGHGFLYQYAELTAAHVNMFLDGFGDLHGGQ